MKKINTLQGHQVLKLCDSVRNGTDTPFDAWYKAEKAYSSKVGFKVTKSNILNALKMLEKPPSLIVKSNHSPIANMHRRMEELEKRVAEIEDILLNSQKP